MTTKKILRASHTQMKRPASPLCGTHNLPLTFVPVEGAWLCQMEDCKTKKYPKQVMENDGYPLIAKGELELVYYLDENKIENTLLRSTGNNMIFDVTSLEPNVLSHGDGSVTIQFTINRSADIDGFGNKKRRGHRY